MLVIHSYNMSNVMLRYVLVVLCTVLHDSSVLTLSTRIKVSVFEALNVHV